jgi:NADH:ubiquinone oxidoreductase subunit C
MSDLPSRVARVLAGADVPAEPEWTFATLTVDVPHRRWRAAVGALRDEAGCTYFDWLGAVDETPDGIRVVARLVALPERPPGVDALLVRTMMPSGRTRIDSLVPVYAGAAWHEREAAEMFGLQFVGGVDPTPLLLADEFEGHPLRKDFVLASRVVTAWPGAKDPADGDAAPSRRRTRPPGVPAGNWGASTDKARRTRRSSDSTAVTPPRGDRDG